MKTLPSSLLAGARPCSLREVVWPEPLEVLVMAPHPDDFDAIGLTLRHLHGQGHRLHLAVLTGGASGVDDGFGGATDVRAKNELREAEQRASCAFFGLPAERLHFLRLWDGSPESGDAARLLEWMAARPADLVFMPHGNDSTRPTVEPARPFAPRPRNSDGEPGPASIATRKRWGCGPTCTSISGKRTRRGRRSCCVFTARSRSATCARAARASTRACWR